MRPAGHDHPHGPGQGIDRGGATPRVQRTTGPAQAGSREPCLRRMPQTPVQRRNDVADVVQAQLAEARRGANRRLAQAGGRDSVSQVQIVTFRFAQSRS
jgi:hypothetical protein